MKYTWGLNSYADHLYVADDNGDKGVACGYTYDAYAVTERQVSFDGTNVALNQTFAYTPTNWSLSNGYKTTTITSVDEVTNTTTKTTYTYNAMGVPGGPYEPFTGSLVAPVEGSVVYQDNSGNTLRTTNKSWSDGSMMTCASVNQNGSISRTDYNPGALWPWSTKQEWAMNAQAACPASYTAPTGTPLRETDYTGKDINVQIYPKTYWPNSAYPVFVRPASVTVKYSGAQAAQTTYTYDGSSLASGGTTVGRDTNYNGTTITARGNATGKSEWVNTTGTSLPWSYTYDDTGQQLSMTDPKSNVTNYQYTDSYSSTCGSPPGSTNAYLTTIEDAKLFTESFTYRYCDGQLSSAKDWNSQLTSYSYVDSFARLTEISDPDGGTTTYTYNDAGLTPSVVTSQTIDSTNTYVTTKIMDAIGHETRSQLNTDPDCSSGADNTDTSYDGMGRVRSVSNAYCSASPDPHSTGTTTYTYDAVGRTTSFAYPDGSTTNTSYSAYTTTVADPAGITRALTYDGLGRLQKVVENPGGLGYQTTYTYNALDDLLTVTQGSQTRAFVYDSLSRMTSSTNPESGTTNYTYSTPSSICSGDPSAVCTRTDARAIKTTYAYGDPLNRLTSKTYPTGTQTAKFFYDESSVTLGSWGSGTLANPKGRLTHTTTLNSGLSVTTGTVQDYDPMGRVADFYQYLPTGCGSNPVCSSKYQYEYTGEVSKWTHPWGFTLTNTISQARRITSIQSSWVDAQHPQSLAKSIYYMPWGAVSKFVNGYVSGGAPATESYIYNKRLQPWVIQLTAGANQTTALCLVYNYYSAAWTPPASCPTSSQLPPTGTTDNGNVWGVWDDDMTVTANCHTAAYSYDAVNRLSSAVGTPCASGDESYSFPYTYTADGSNGQYGNMSCVFNGQIAGCSDFSFSATNNHITSTGYTYDAAGNLTEDSSNLSPHTYQWDAEGRVSSVDGGIAWGFTYNALGQRVLWSYSGGQNQYMFDPAGNWLGSVGAWAVVRFGGRYMLVDTPSESYFNHVNSIDSSSMETDHTGTPIEDVLFFPWGQWSYSGSGGFNYAGIPFTDLKDTTDIAPARFYGPNFGRWFSPDPDNAGADSSDPQTWNMYAYVRNNPTTLTDPSGRCDWCQRLKNWAGGNGWVSDAELAGSLQAGETPNGPSLPPRTDTLVNAQDAAMQNPNYQRGDDGATHCNQATCAVASAVGAPMGPLTDAQGNALRANQIRANLADPESGYHEVSATEGQQLANQGSFVIVAGPGHVSSVRPDNIPGENVPGRGPVIANVGAVNGVQRLNYVFRSSALPDVRFYTPNH